MTTAEPTGQFAADMMQLGQQNERMQSLIGELASCQLGQSADASTIGAATRRLTDEGGLISYVGDAVADVIDLFRSSPSFWRSLEMRYFRSMAHDGRSLYSVEEPLRTLCRVQSKIGMFTVMHFEYLEARGCIHVLIFLFLVYRSGGIHT